MAPVEGRVRVTVAFSPSTRIVDLVDLVLDQGSTVADALAASGLQDRYPELKFAELAVGIWGALCDRSDTVRDRDRVELYRPLRVDPKDARRQRQQAQRAVKR